LRSLFALGLDGLADLSDFLEFLCRTGFKLFGFALDALGLGG